MFTSFNQPATTQTNRKLSGLLKLMQALQQFVWIWLTLILSLYLSWILLAQTNFLYSLWYDFAGIKENIEQYAPLNHYRKGFELTDDDTRKTLFAGMVTAIHSQGQGLATLKYAHPTLPHLTPLLHQSEIQHLTDVAQLIEFLKTLGWGILFLWSLLTALHLWKRQSFPSTRTISLNLLIGTALLGAFLLGFGAKNVFYQLHIWIFPANHQWFFYYQDSLMSTMMKAPDLFGYISASLFFVALLIFMLLLKVLTQVNQSKTG